MKYKWKNDTILSIEKKKKLKESYFSFRITPSQPILKNKIRLEIKIRDLLN
jgi:hypothetical protein